ncbi:MAG TPA: hypothetical protein VLU91_03210 [Nitrososphaerales archaeon]|nr:hypothetical protein [Nitrososphaerales archaeon]
MRKKQATVLVEVWDPESGWTTSSPAFYTAREARRYMKEHRIEEGTRARVMDHGSLKKNIEVEQEFRRKKRKKAKEELHK